MQSLNIPHNLLQNALYKGYLKVDAFTSPFLFKYLCVMGNLKLLEERQNEVVEEFSMFSDWMEKYEYIIETGKELYPMVESEKIEENLIKGCQSRVWLTARKNEEGDLIFSADSDAIITKGLVALMVRVLSGAKPEDVASVDLHFLDFTIGLINT